MIDISCTIARDFLQLLMNALSRRARIAQNMIQVMEVPYQSSSQHGVGWKGRAPPCAAKVLRTSSQASVTPPFAENDGYLRDRAHLEDGERSLNRAHVPHSPFPPTLVSVSLYIFIACIRLASSADL